MDDVKNHTTHHLGDIGFPIEEAVYLAGVDYTRLRNWLDRYKLLAGKGPGRGGRGRKRNFSTGDIFAVRTVRALVEDGGLRAVDAAAAVIPINPIRWLYIGETLDLAQDASGVWGDPPGRARVRLVVDPEAIYREMRPRFMELAPAETEAFDQFLAELREKRASR